MRRVSVAALLVALFAISGAAVAPTRGAAGSRTAVSIVWKQRGARTVPVARQVAQRSVAIGLARTAITSPLRVETRPVPARHALFQRPPPAVVS
ncbi:MAG TPA: hypothetical protein VGF24_30045 [Vicinamibacterales bacterium]|jgi:hypothetical protein